jgi:hypothetical protein
MYPLNDNYVWPLKSLSKIDVPLISCDSIGIVIQIHEVNAFQPVIVLRKLQKTDT